LELSFTTQEKENTVLKILLKKTLEDTGASQIDVPLLPNFLKIKTNENQIIYFSICYNGNFYASSN
jgi:hypothetical protein